MNPWPSGALVRDPAVPELGLGRVVAAEGEPEPGRIQVRWGEEAEPRSVRLDEERSLRRARLHPGQRVQLDDAPGGEATVADLADLTPEGCARYQLSLPSGAPFVMSEASLTPLPPASDDPLALLTGLGWQRSGAFHARVALLRTVSLWHENAYGIPPLLGARITPMAHQLHAARRVLTDRRPRYVLADEVGLGKTIEAGLVIQALTSARPELRVLVIAPGAMSRQWLCELFLRFGEQVYVHVDAARAEAGVDPELWDAQRLIVSTTALLAVPAIRAELLASPRDLVVIDEAHQIAPGHELYPFLRQLAEASEGLLLLSATPGKRDQAGLLGLLALVAPDVYDPDQPALLRERLAAQEALAPALVALLDHVEAGGQAAQGQALAAELAGHLPDDPAAQALVSEGQVEELLAYVQEHHRLDRRVIRTRRGTVTALGTRLCRRELEVVRYPKQKAEKRLLEHVEALAAGLPESAPPLSRALCGVLLRAAVTTPLALLELLEERRQAIAAGGGARRGGSTGEGVDEDVLTALASDPGPGEEEALLARIRRRAPELPGEREWLKQAVALTKEWMVQGKDGCARFRAAISWIKNHLGAGRGRKVLVFAQTQGVVEELAAELAEIFGPDAVGAIHHAKDELQLSEIALRFQRPGGIRVLVSDELGGEGRNFQIASAVVHLDQPWATARLEQRVGRLDRVGRDPERPAHSVVLIGPSPSEEALLELHGKAFGVYERSLGGLEFVLPSWQQRIFQAACRGHAALEALVPEAAADVAAARREADEAYERAQDASRQGLEEAAEQAEVLAEADLEDDVQSLAGWGRRIGIRFEPLDEQVWGVRWKWEKLRRIPDGIAPASGVPEEGRVRRRGTLSRTKALEDEALELFAPGHPLVDGLVRDAREAPDGRAAVFARDLGAGAVGRWFLVCHFETTLDRSAWGDEAPPPGLVHRALVRAWPQSRLVCLELLPGQTPAAVELEDRPLIRALSEKGDSALDQALDPDEVGELTNLGALSAAVRSAVAAAEASVQRSRQAEIDEAVESLGDDLRLEQGYLAGRLQRAAGPERERLEQELRARERLLQSVRGQGLRLDALALVVGIRTPGVID